MEHKIARKYDSILEALYRITNCEKTSSEIVNELYKKFKLYKYRTYYLGTFFIKYKHSFLVMLDDESVIITVGIKDKKYNFYLLDGSISYNINYISITRNKDISNIYISHENKAENIELEIIENRFKFIWK